MHATNRTRTPAPAVDADPRLERALRHAVAIGAVLVLLLPAARGQSSWIGALPLWLLGMPLASWWALHRFRLPRIEPRIATATGHRQRRSGRPQARRRTAAQSRRSGIAHAA